MSHQAFAQLLICLFVVIVLAGNAAQRIHDRNINRLKEIIMSAANDAVTTIVQEVTDASARITAKIAELQAAVEAAPSGDDVVSPETVAALQSAGEALAAIVPVPAPVDPAPSA